MKFIYVKATKAWVNPRHVVSVFRSNAEWTITLVNGTNYVITDDEYLELLPFLQGGGKD